ncbi:MAG: hypoxanthine phosphoribosyltransferase [Coriobacteriia bacterium]|nr:hypoxanthine phosphoribosyltransferase [Coriobacteriia bacterium]
MHPTPAVAAFDEQPSPHGDLTSVLISKEQLASRIAQMGADITQDYADKNPLLIGVLKGAVYFMTDLTRRIDCPLTMDFMAVSSYGDAHRSSGVVRIIKDLNEPVTDRHVIILEDILDTGLTLKYLARNFHGRGAASIAIATLLLKEGTQAVPLDVQYVGFTIPDAFVVGYGLDYAQHYRNLPYIGILKPALYAE